MSHGAFFVSNVNPNDNMGGGGCVCSPIKQIDCKPPYILVPGNDLDDIRSPHVVVCQACIERMGHMIQGEALESGERGVTFNHEAPQHQLPLPQMVPSVDDDEDLPEV